MTFVETSAASASGSIVAYAIMRILRSLRDKTKVKGLLLVKGKTYAEKHFSTEDVIFFDLDGHLDEKVALNEQEAHDVRLKLFPEAKKVLKALKLNFRNKTIVLCSSSYELLNYLKVKQVFTILPSARMMNECIAPVQAIADASKARASTMTGLDKLRMVLSVKMPKKYQHLSDSWDDQTKLIRAIFDVLDRVF